MTKNEIYVVQVNIEDSDHYSVGQDHEFETLKEAEDFAVKWVLEGDYYKYDDKYQIIFREITFINTDDLDVKIAAKKEELRLKKEEALALCLAKATKEKEELQYQEYLKLKEKFEPAFEPGHKR